MSKYWSANKITIVYNAYQHYNWWLFHYLHRNHYTECYVVFIYMFSHLWDYFLTFHELYIIFFGLYIWILSRIIIGHIIHFSWNIKTSVLNYIFQIHKKYILPPGTTVTGLSVIDEASMMTQIKDDDEDHQEHHQQNDHQQHLQQHYHCDLQDPSETVDSNDDDDGKIPISLVAIASSALPESGASSPNSLNGSTSQQLTDQVSVVQSQDDMEPHYITVTGECWHIQVILRIRSLYK